jgi:hypothetical protein
MGKWIILLNSTSHRLLIRHIRLHRYRDTLPDSAGARAIFVAELFRWGSTHTAPNNTAA